MLTQGYYDYLFQLLPEENEGLKIKLQHRYENNSIGGDAFGFFADSTKYIATSIIRRSEKGFKSYNFSELYDEVYVKGVYASPDGAYVLFDLSYKYDWSTNARSKTVIMNAKNLYIEREVENVNAVCALKPYGRFSHSGDLAIIDGSVYDFATLEKLKDLSMLGQYTADKYVYLDEEYMSFSPAGKFIISINHFDHQIKIFGIA